MDNEKYEGQEENIISEIENEGSKECKSENDDNYMIEGMAIGMVLGSITGFSFLSDIFGGGVVGGMIAGMLIGLCISKKKKPNDTNSA